MENLKDTSFDENEDNSSGMNSEQVFTFVITRFWVTNQLCSTRFHCTLISKIVPKLFDLQNRRKVWNSTPVFFSLKVLSSRISCPIFSRKRYALKINNLYIIIKNPLILILGYSAGAAEEIRTRQMKRSRIVDIPPSSQFTPEKVRKHPGPPILQFLELRKSCINRILL